MIGRVVVSSLARPRRADEDVEPRARSAPHGPFDAKRSGFVLGEGAGLLVLETEEFARRRGRRSSASSPAPAGPSTRPTTRLRTSTARRWRCSAPSRTPASPWTTSSYINAHGTSTQLNDKTETAAIKKVFGERAYGIAISSTKSMTGHLAAAAGAVEAAVGVLTIRDQTIAPTINYETPDPACDLDYVPLKARKADVGVVLSNAFGLGGQNTCLVLKRYTELAMTYVAWMNEGALRASRSGARAPRSPTWPLPASTCRSASASPPRPIATSPRATVSIARSKRLWRRSISAHPLSVTQAAGEIEALVAAASIPDDLQAVVTEAYAKLMAQQDMAVRRALVRGVGGRRGGLIRRSVRDLPQRARRA